MVSCLVILSRLKYIGAATYLSRIIPIGELVYANFSPEEGRTCLTSLKGTKRCEGSLLSCSKESRSHKSVDEKHADALQEM